MQDRDGRDGPSIGAELIQLERALSKLVKAAESYRAQACGVEPIHELNLIDALSNARNHLS